jgi:hypothetical protein
MVRNFLSKSIVIGVGSAAILASPQTLLAGDDDGSKKKKGEYLSGDFHNHTTCSDGSTSVQTLTKESLIYLDWFIQSGHSGSYPRDCRIDDFSGTFAEGDYVTGDGPNDGQGDWWQNTVGFAGIKGDTKSDDDWGCADGSPGNPPNTPQGQCQEMWRWQSLQEFNLPGVRDEGIAAKEPAFIGVEWVVSGHEHSSASIIAGQYGEDPNADALAQYEYCFASPSDDTSQGDGQGWTCELSDANNQAPIDRFSADPDQGVADYNGTLGDKGVNIDDDGDHVKSTAAIYWMRENYAGQSYAVAAHVERQGAFIPGANEGYNVEHLRDWNNASPDVSFGFESQPGHQAQPERGSHNAGRPTAGLWTWGGTGCYAAAEASKPGVDFDGEPLTAGDFSAEGRYPEIDDDEDPAKVVLCRSGVRTMWDAMLSEGRRFWFFGSSDWHNRGMFSPFEAETTNDFWPGEYQKNYTFVRAKHADNPAEDIVYGLRSGNGYVVQGDLIDKLEFLACADDECVTMGRTLRVKEGEDVKVKIKARDPKGTNLSPYSFANPSLRQVGIEQPLNKPKLVRVDLIKGEVEDPIDPEADEYKNPLAPHTTKLAKSWTKDDWRGDDPWKEMSYKLRHVKRDMYVRIRGTNVPAGTPNEQDENGHPLADKLSDKILCADPDCPEHISEAFL